MEHLLPELQSYLKNLPAEALPAERQAVLRPLADFVTAQLPQEESVPITFICTHNSRRSHFGQVWARVWAVALGLDQVVTYSGGTEATACHPHTLRALAAAGLRIEPQSEGPNPHYLIHFSESYPPIEAWSKVYTDPANPQRGFGAVMTCDSANEGCPVVVGAAARFPILYEDPKAFDGTPQEAAAYAERCAQIAKEMRFVMERVREKV
ncbi:MAG: protein-tyrosine-phosphatase [Bacteroidetes bacterium]|nr:MAG: protein-tyrosine-phosphatase [Bacteroidota bacterium]